MRDLAAGTEISASDVTYTDVRLPAQDYGRYAAAADDLAGRTLTVQLHRGELVPLSSFVRTPAHTTMTVPLAAGAAPPLSHGERVVLWLSTPTCTAQLLVAGATVQAVRSATGYTSDGSQQVVLSLAPAVADRLVEALGIANSMIRAGIEYGPSTADPLPPLDLCEPSATGATGATTP